MIPDTHIINIFKAVPDEVYDKKTDIPQIETNTYFAFVYIVCADIKCPETKSRLLFNNRPQQQPSA